jgi:cyanate lyase
MINRKAIKNRMKETGVTIKEIAQAIGRSECVTYEKIGGRSYLTVDQAENIQKVLNIPDHDFGHYFFA